MGPKCSCLSNKEEGTTFYFLPGQQISSTELIASKLKSANKNSRSANKLAKEITNIKMSQLQGIIRGYLKRKHIKEDLNKSRDIKIKQLKLNYLLDNLIKAEAKFPAFNKNGWTKYYGEAKCKLDYGKTYDKLLTGVNCFYSGQVNAKDQKHSYGDLLKIDGSKYTGQWLNEDFTGWGRYIDSEGNVYEGLLNGKGSKILLDGSNSYTGDFSNGLKEGFGNEECEEYTYEGLYKNDLKEGKGRLTYKFTNDTYDGNFSNNVINGYGFYTWNNQHTYTGSFTEGKMQGKGVYKWPDGGEYVGDYNNNLKEGRGKFKWPNGREYEGPFFNGNPNGIGTLIGRDRIQQVEFIDGKLNKSYRKAKTEMNNRLRKNKQKGTYDSSTPSINLILQIPTTLRIQK